MHTPISPAVSWLQENCGDTEEKTRSHLSDELQEQLSILNAKKYRYSETLKIPQDHALTWLKLRYSQAPSMALSHVLNEARRNIHADFTHLLKQYSLFDKDL